MHLFVLVWAPTLVQTLSEHEDQHGQTLPLGLVFANFMLRFVMDDSDRTFVSDGLDRTLLHALLVLSTVVVSRLRVNFDNIKILMYCQKL